VQLSDNDIGRVALGDCQGLLPIDSLMDDIPTRDEKSFVSVPNILIGLNDNREPWRRRKWR